MEIPTWRVAFAVYGGWFVVTGFGRAIPIWLLIPIGGFIVAWHGSLQHETIHGHPTRSRRINALVGGAPLGLWLPYGIYAETHLRHHATPHLTDPRHDPESFYVTPEAWSAMGAAHRALLHAQTTLVGRVLIGPFYRVATFLAGELSLLARGETRRLRAWGVHAIGSALVVGWVCGVCRLPFATYVVAFVYPGLALTLLRSFAEHRPGARGREDNVVVEAGPIASLLYLNNNLHAEHHAAPGVAWYELPARYAAHGRAAYRFSSYVALFARYALRAKDSPVVAR